MLRPYPLSHPSLHWAAALLPGGRAGFERTLAGFATWVGLAAFSKKLPEWGKKSLTTGYALMSIFLAVLVCIFTGPF